VGAPGDPAGRGRGARPGGGGRVAAGAGGPGRANAAATLPHLDDALAAGIPDAEYRLLTSEGAEPDALLQFAVQEF
jgi:hypothetical protein